MIHKCPICRYQPVELKESEWFCPECGWESEVSKMVLWKGNNSLPKSVAFSEEKTDIEISINLLNS